jgi:anthranilate/para-aminobenzoate synthase component I
MKTTTLLSTLPGFAIAFLGDTAAPYIFLEPTSSRSYNPAQTKTWNDEQLDTWLHSHRAHTTTTQGPSAFGFISYEHCYRLEPTIDRPSTTSSRLPEYLFYEYRTIIDVKQQRIERHLDQPAWWHVSDQQLDELLAEWHAFLKHPIYQAQHESVVPELPADTRLAFQNGIRAIQEKILEGYVYQANLSLQLKRTTARSPIETFLRVLSKEQGAYSCFLSCEDLDKQQTAFISNSPELFIKRTSNRLVTAPIKGTTPRMRGYLANETALHNLRHSEKDIAELAMIVDLFRNDLSKLCHAGTVKTGAFPTALSLQHIHHLYCTVSGTLHTEHPDRIILESLFPSGSITGAPKYTALQTIANLEQRARGVYCGSFVSFSQDGFTANVAIRTAQQQENSLTLQAGCGITIDSTEQSETDEAQRKLSAFLD